jgi:hypothetical protein
VTPSAWIFGLGFNAFSAVCNDLGQGYSHATFADVLCELGIPAFGVLLAILWITFGSGRSLFRRFKDHPGDRAVIATLLAMVIYQVLIANKEGNLWGSLNLFMYCIVVTRLEVRTRSMDIQLADTSNSAVGTAFAFNPVGDASGTGVLAAQGGGHRSEIRAR